MDILPPAASNYINMGMWTTAYEEWYKGHLQEPVCIYPQMCGHIGKVNLQEPVCMYPQACGHIGKVN